jgi:eukaryotic-like serine/threonine-protein kinase
VYDVLQEDGDTYIVMELVEAPTLSALVAREGPLPSDAVARLGDQLLSALGVAHAAGVVHRDVMVLPNGRLKLTDFGVARAAEPRTEPVDRPAADDEDFSCRTFLRRS